MKTYSKLFLFLISGILFSCSKNSGGILKLRKAEEIEPEYLNKNIILRSVLSLNIIDGNLLMENEYRDSVFYFYKKNGERISSSVGINNSPEGMLGSIIVGYDNSNKILEVFDNRKSKLFYLKNDSCNLRVKKIVDVKRDMHVHLNVKKIKNNLYVAKTFNVKDKNSRPLTLLDSSFNVIKTFGGIKTSGKYIRQKVPFDGFLSVKGDYFAYVTEYGGYISFYKVEKNDSIKKIWDHYLSKIVLKNQFLDMENMMFGFLDIKLTRHYVFCSYVGKDYNTVVNKDKALYSNNILVFDYNGKLVHNYYTDKRITRIAISDDEKTIYAVCLDPDLSLVKFKL